MSPTTSFNVPKVPFTTLSDFEDKVLTQRDLLDSDQSACQYLIFTSTPKSIAKKLLFGELLISKAVRLTYESRSRDLTAKIKLGPPYETAIELITYLIYNKARFLGCGKLTKPVGSATMAFGTWFKQADKCLKPYSPIAPKPVSFTIEVGISESDPLLAAEANEWLRPKNASPSVKLVLTISINRTRPDILFQLWENPPRTCTTSTRANWSLCRPSQVIRVSRGPQMQPVYAGSKQLTLPLHKILDRPLVPLERDLILTAPDLYDIAEEIWDEMTSLKGCYLGSPSVASS